MALWSLIWMVIVSSSLFGDHDVSAVHTNSLSLSSTYHIVDKKPLSVVSDRFLSYTLEPGELIHVADCGEANDTSNLIRTLLPAYLRIAGPDSKKLLFENQNLDEPMNVTSGDKNRKLDNILVKGPQWLKFIDFVKNKTGLQIIISLNGNFERDHSDLDLTNALEFITFSSKNNLDLDWELGYEFQKMSDHDGRILGRDVTKLRKVLDVFPRYRKSLILGPDMTSLETRGDVAFTQSYLSEAGDSLDVFTVHYDFSNLKEDDDVFGKLSPIFNRMDTYLWIKDGILKTLAKGVVDRKSIWLSESENKSQYCSFAETLSFIQRLGAAAKLGVSVYLRKPCLMSLSVPTSEYWAAVLFKSLVGKIVLDARYVDGNNTNVFAFGHCTRVLSSTDDSIINPYVAYKPGAITLYGVNTGSEWSRFFFKLNSKYEQVAHLYILTEDRDSYKEKTLFNRQELRLSDDNELPIVFPRIREYVKYVMLPPKSIFFLVLPYANSRACMTNLPNADESQYIGKKKSSLANDSSVVDLVGILEEDDLDDGAIYVSYASKKQESSTTPSPDATKAIPSAKTRFITYSEDTWLSPLPDQLKEIFYRGPVRTRDDAGVPQSNSRSKKEKRLTKIDTYRVITQALLGKRNVSQNISQESPSRYSRSMDTYAHDQEVEGRGERDKVHEMVMVEEGMLNRDPARMKEDVVTTTPSSHSEREKRQTNIKNYRVITQALLGKRNVSQNVSEEPLSRHPRSVNAYIDDQEVEDEEEEQGEVDKMVMVEEDMFDSNQARMKRQNYITQALLDVSQSISKAFSRPSRSVDAYAEDQVSGGKGEQYEVHETVSVVGGLFDGDDNTKIEATNDEQELNTRALIHLLKRRDVDTNDSHSVMMTTSSFPSDIENLSNSAKAALLLFDVEEGDKNVRPSREISSDLFDTRPQRIVPLPHKSKKGKHPDEVVLSYPTHQHKTTASASVMSNPPPSDENPTPVSIQMNESTTSTTPAALLGLRSDKVNESGILASDETSEHVSKETTSIAETMPIGSVPETGRSSMDEEETVARKKPELAPTPNPHQNPEKIPIINPIKRKPGYMSTITPTTSTSKLRRRSRIRTTKPTSPEPSPSPSPITASTKRRRRRTTTSRPTTSTTSASYSTRKRGGSLIHDHQKRPTDTLPKQIEVAHEKVKQIIDANRAKIQTMKDERMQRKSLHPAVRLKREVAQPNLHEMKTLPTPHHIHPNKLTSESSHQKVRGLTNDAIDKATELSSDVSENVREKIRLLTSWTREKYNEIKKDLVSTRSMQDLAQVKKLIREYSAKIQKELAGLREHLRSHSPAKTSSRRKSMQLAESGTRLGQHQNHHHEKITPKSAKSAEITYEDQEFVTPPITTIQPAGQNDQDNLTSDLFISRSIRSIESNEISSDDDDVPPPSADSALDRNEIPGLDQFEANMMDTKLRKVASQFAHPIRTPPTRIEDEWFGGAATKKVHRHDLKRDDASTKSMEIPSENVVNIDEICDRKASVLSYVWCKCKNFLFVVLSVLNDGQHD